MVYARQSSVLPQGGHDIHVVYTVWGIASCTRIRQDFERMHHCGEQQAQKVTEDRAIQSMKEARCPTLSSRRPPTRVRVEDAHTDM